MKKSFNKKLHYITKHLPKQFQQERKALLPQLKEAKHMKTKVSWNKVDLRFLNKLFE